MVAANVKAGKVNNRNLFEPSKMAKCMWGEHSTINNRDFIVCNVVEFIRECHPYADLTGVGGVINDEIEKRVFIERY